MPYGPSSKRASPEQGTGATRASTPSARCSAPWPVCGATRPFSVPKDFSPMPRLRAKARLLQRICPTNGTQAARRRQRAKASCFHWQIQPPRKPLAPRSRTSRPVLKGPPTAIHFLQRKIRPPAGPTSALGPVPLLLLQDGGRCGDPLGRLAAGGPIPKTSLDLEQRRTQAPIAESALKC